MSNVIIEARGQVALITLNRPQKLNALDYPLIDRLLEVLDAMEEDDQVRALVLTGAGERAFSSGADIACFAPSVRRGPAVALREFVRRGQGVAGRIERVSQAIIVGGHRRAPGGGFGVVEAAPPPIAGGGAGVPQAAIGPRLWP